MNDLDKALREGKMTPDLKNAVTQPGQRKPAPVLEHSVEAQMVGIDLTQKILAQFCPMGPSSSPAENEQKVAWASTIAKWIMEAWGFQFATVNRGPTSPAA